MASTVTPQKLLFWLDKRYNVLLSGRHGIGKTAMIVEAFKARNLRWAYFSTATMDPFIDFIGVPVKTEIEAPKPIPLEDALGIDTGGLGKKLSVIELIRPRWIVENDFQAIFLDEYNRSHKRIRNATMEMIQFGTINGKPFSSDLRCIWAAINPEEDDAELKYDVEPLDPAQRDRFVVQVDLPYVCDSAYFEREYGETQGKAAVQFWKDLPDDVKLAVSPRRLEYAVKAYRDGADLRDILPEKANPSRLASMLVSGPAEQKLAALMGNDDAARRFLVNENNYTYALSTILQDKKYVEYFLPLMPLEKISTLFSQGGLPKKAMLDDMRINQKQSVYFPLLHDIAVANQNAKEAAEIRRELDKINIPVAPAQVPMVFSTPVKDASAALANALALDNLNKEKKPQTWHRQTAYARLLKSIPQNMTLEGAKSVIAICADLCRSYQKTVHQKMPKLVGISNHAIAVMLRGGMAFDKVDEQIRSYRRLNSYRTAQNAASVLDIMRMVKAEKDTTLDASLAGMPGRRLSRARFRDESNNA